MITGGLNSGAENDHLNRLWYGFNYATWNCFYTFLFSLRKQGWENVPRSGPVMLVANHQSFLDPIAIGLAAYRKISFLTRKSLFNNAAIGTYLKSVGCCPINIEGVAKEGIRSTLELLNQGKAVLIFPEGTRSEDGMLQELKPGIQLLIKKSNAIIIPVGIAGAFEALKMGQKWPNFCPTFLSGNKGAIAISIGKPLNAKLLANLPREESLAFIKDSISKEITKANNLRRKK